MIQIGFYSFLALSQKPKIRIKFSASWWSGNKKHFCVLFIASHALLQSHVKSNRHSKRNFLTCYSCSHYSSMPLSTIFFHCKSNEIYYWKRKIFFLPTKKLIVLFRYPQKNMSFRCHLTADWVLRCMKYDNKKDAEKCVGTMVLLPKKLLLKHISIC